MITTQAFSSVVDISPEPLYLAQQLSVDFSNGDRILFADLYTAFTPDTFLCINRNRLFILHFKDIYRTDIYALIAAYAFFFINLYLVHILTPFQCGAR